jgi:hypothetical protein
VIATPIILGEVWFGILLLGRGRKRSVLERWFDGGVQRRRLASGGRNFLRAAGEWARDAGLVADLRTIASFSGSISSADAARRFANLGQWNPTSNTPPHQTA